MIKLDRSFCNFFVRIWMTMTSVSLVNRRRMSSIIWSNHPWDFSSIKFSFHGTVQSTEKLVPHVCGFHKTTSLMWNQLLKLSLDSRLKFRMCPNTVFLYLDFIFASQRKSTLQMGVHKNYSIQLVICVDQMNCERITKWKIRKYWEIMYNKHFRFRRFSKR